MTTVRERRQGKVSKVSIQTDEIELISYTYEAGL
jgi:hypothetical protein